MRYIFSVGFLLVCCFGHAKEWKSLNAFEKVNGKRELRATDWLKSDRRRNTQVWQNANIYNLQHNYFLEYETIKERRDFYKWFFSKMEARHCEVVWPKMAYYISNKLRLVNAFPFSVFTTKSVKSYAYQGSETVFNHAFKTLKALYLSEDVLKSNAAMQWDESIIHKEQYIWLKGIYEGIDDKGLRTIERMAKGKGFYCVLVPKKIRFKSDISVTKNRYDYALHVLRDFCENH
ncbi:Insecticidal toxin complex protein [Tamlana agarivorans]|uniref:Insecticidal toxin complex protein n=1 Tax=Pseudotamlana agarivorans TaxID=481183 RepID=A0ACC5UCL7_9FLAO|nr:Insecticidal toxin complex protein [Tamlana agarivorans]MBU2952087.1 Insecticidal toxin complex protein [Tamlana agarivorans]